MNGHDPTYRAEDVAPCTLDGKIGEIYIIGQVSKTLDKPRKVGYEVIESRRSSGIGEKNADIEL